MEGSSIIGVGELDREGMQKLPFEAPFLIHFLKAIDTIANNRSASFTQVDTDLVGSPCVRGDFNKRKLVIGT